MSTSFSDLLGIQERAPNNGTYGRLHGVLTKSPSVNEKNASPINKCVHSSSEALWEVEACDAKCIEKAVRSFVLEKIVRWTDFDFSAKQVKII